VVVLWAGVAAAAEQPQAKIVQDTWETAYLADNRAGYVHTITRAITREGETFHQTTSELNLTVKRFRDTVQLRMETGSEEDKNGKVTSVSMRQFLGKDQQMVMIGTVEGERLHIIVEEIRGNEKTRKMDKTIPWNDDVLGLYRQQLLYKQRKVKPGDSFDYQSYEPTITYVVKTQVNVKDFEEVAVGGKKARLLRVEAAPEKLVVGANQVQLPELVAWLDKNYETILSEVDVPGLGKLTLIRSSRAEAARDLAGTTARLPDIAQMVPLNRRIPKAYDVREAVYRITVKGDKDAASAFAQDRRQKALNAHGDTFDLHIRAQRPSADLPGKIDRSEDFDKEYLGSSYFINCNDAMVKAHAREAVGAETDPWRKAVAIERWVHEHMQNKNYSEAFATSEHVARTLEGDCTEHAVLTAAMCRAVKVPARTAFGLIYVERLENRQALPEMGFHMWTEVWIRGQWLPIDATLGRGFVGASHIKVSDHSWHNVETLTPLLPVVRVVGKVAIQVESFEMR
jgi:hypothetical protein